MNRVLQDLTDSLGSKMLTHLFFYILKSSLHFQKRSTNQIKYYDLFKPD